jgi:hypothetical protein
MATEPPKASMTWPKMSVMMGCVTPLASAPTVPRSISMTSVPSAYRNSPVNDTLLSPASPPPLPLFSSFSSPSLPPGAAAASIARGLVWYGARACLWGGFLQSYGSLCAYFSRVFMGLRWWHSSQVACPTSVAKHFIKWFD